MGSCGEYQSVLRSEDSTAKYAMADSLYKVGKYRKALRLMEQLVPLYRGKPQSEALMYKYANTFYNLEDYFLSGYQFERFVTSYPKSDSVEMAAYKSAKSYYEISQDFLWTKRKPIRHWKNCNSLSTNILRQPTEMKPIAWLPNCVQNSKKDFETAKQFLRIYDYKASISAFDNFIRDHPGSEFRKEAFYHRLEAAYLLAINSLPSLVRDRLETSTKYYNDFVKYYGESDMKEDADEIMSDINERLIEYNTEIN